MLDSLYENIIADQFLKPFPFDLSKRVVVKTMVKTVYLLRSLWTNKATQGNDIYNLVYISPALPYLVLHYISEVFHIIHTSYKDRLGLLSKLWNLAILLNWLSFLISGKYRTTMERLGKIQLLPKVQNKRLNLDYTFTQRATFFQIITDTLRVVIPYLKIETFVKFLNDEINLTRNENETCVVCGEEEIVSPVGFRNCQHLACYVCFKGIKKEKCVRCKE